VKIRPATEADAEAIADVCNALSRALYGDPDVSVEEIKRWMAMPDLEMFVGEEDGRVVAYLDLRAEEGGEVSADVRVHPDAWGRRLADALLEYSEEWARAKRGAGTRVRAFPAEPEAELREAAERRGYQSIRHFFTMQVDFDAAPVVRWPDGFTVRSFEAADEARVYEAQMESFADHWDHHRVPFETWRTWTIGRNDFDPSLWLLAEDGDEIAGISLNSWHRSGDPQFGWLNVLGVRSPWRRRGLGDALLRGTFAMWAERGAKKVGLGVDTENPTGALRLYERAGMRPVRRQDLYEKRA
jgi:mycothiol synthase